ncbi:MAG: cation diffusion facilitator family transporter [Cellulosilyticaceae bacterium]
MNTYQEAKKVSIITIIINITLGLFKVIAGVVGSSTAMIADGIHTASDVVTTIMVIIGVKISSKDADSEHPYGHERFEPVFGKLISLFLAFTGVMIGYEGLMALIQGEYSKPAPIALIAAFVSIIVKEGMYWYTLKTAKKIKSVSMEADAWHHRTDAFSSIGTFIGILGASLGWTFLDPLTAVIVSGFIIKVGIDLYLQSMNQLVDKAAPTELIKQIQSLATQESDVKGIHDLKTRVSGNKVYVDLEIYVDKRINIEEGHKIATKVHDLLERNIEEIKHCMVHVEPY